MEVNSETTRGEIVYHLRHQGYSFESLGKLFNLTKQRAYGIYWQYWNKHKKTDAHKCDLCERLFEKPVTWKWKSFKLCSDCWGLVKKHRLSKWKQGL